MNLSVYTDGGSRGNPGISGYGLVVYTDSKKILYQESKFLGVKTNNEAEYLGLIAALTWLKDHSQKVDTIRLYSDSELLVKQLNGQYRVKAPHLKPLYFTVLELLSSISPPPTFHHLSRELNSLADSMANLAMDHPHG